MDLIENESVWRRSLWRRNGVAAETLLLQEISKRQLSGYKFRRQVCSEPFVVEFVCNELKLIVELYSGIHVEADGEMNQRSRHLQSKGFLVTRFCHGEVLSDLLGVIDSLSVLCRQRQKEIAMSQLARRYLSGGLGRPVKLPGRI